MQNILKSLSALKFELRCEKTGLRGFQPGPTQTGLYSQKRARGLKFGIQEEVRLYYVAKTNMLISAELLLS